VISRAPSPDSQAWLLVQLAHVLRRRGRSEEALEALELAVGVRRSSGAELAAYACAVAVHVSSGDLETAAKVAESARRRAIDATLLRALGEAHLDLFRETGEGALLDEAFACLELATLEDAFAGN
jgi:tetratricopeptide (TPR) repeat protein